MFNALAVRVTAPDPQEQPGHLTLCLHRWQISSKSGSLSLIIQLIVVPADSLSDLPPRFTGHIQPCLLPAWVMGCLLQGWRPPLDFISGCSDVPDGM